MAYMSILSSAAECVIIELIPWGRAFIGRVSSSGGGQGGSFPPKNLTLIKLSIKISQ